MGDRLGRHHRAYRRSARPVATLFFFFPFKVGSKEQYSTVRGYKIFLLDLVVRLTTSTSPSTSSQFRSFSQFPGRSDFITRSCHCSFLHVLYTTTSSWRNILNFLRPEAKGPVLRSNFARLRRNRPRRASHSHSCSQQPIRALPFLSSQFPAPIKRSHSRPQDTTVPFKHTVFKGSTRQRYHGCN